MKSENLKEGTVAAIYFIIIFWVILLLLKAPGFIDIIPSWVRKGIVTSIIIFIFCIVVEITHEIKKEKNGNPK